MDIISTGNSRSDLQIVSGWEALEAAADMSGTLIQNTYIDPIYGLSFVLNHLSTPYAIPYDLLVPTEERIAPIPWTKLRSNFLRGNPAEPGTVWIMESIDQSIFVHNLTMLAKLAKNSNVLGVFFDLEAYSGSIFWKYTDLSTLHPSSYTFEDYQAAYWQAGFAAGEEMTSVFPGIKIVLAIGFEQLRNVPPQNLPSDKYGLLPAFLNGLYTGVGRDAQIINSLEDGYANRVAGDFDYDLVIQYPENAPYLTSPNYEYVHVDGMSIWCDYPGTGFNFLDPSLNYNTPLGYETNLDLALSRVKYVFNYEQQIRFQAPGPTTTPPQEYYGALTRQYNKYRVYESKNCRC